MQTQPVSGTGPGPSGGQAVPPTTADAFVQVLVAELSRQDPTNALDPAQLVAQLAQLTTVEQLQQVRAGQAWEVAVALLGRSVTAIDPTTGAPLGGTVVGILRGATGPLLQVGGTAVPLESVTSIP
jgi:flagellar basal-body rod modification protein FlgD